MIPRSRTEQTTVCPSRLRTFSLIAGFLMIVSGLAVALISSLPLGPVEDAPLTARTSAVTISEFTVNGATSTTVYVGEEFTLSASASSDTSSNLVFTFYYDAVLDLEMNPNPHSPFTVHSTGSPGEVTTTWTYDRLGNLTGVIGSYYRVKLSVYDGTNTVNLSRSVYVIENTAPYFDLDLPDGYALDPDESIDLSVKVMDDDGDPVTVTWDFGDGTAAVNDTDPLTEAVYINQTHAWSPDIGPGMGPELYYHLVVTAEDPYSNLCSQDVLVTISLPYNGLPVIDFDSSITTLDPEVEMVFYASAADPEGEALTWTFVFNNSIEVVDTVVSHTDATAPGETVWNNLTYVFATPGTYKVRLWVSDAEIPYQISPHNVTIECTITVRGNAPPSVSREIYMSDENPTIEVLIGYASVTFRVDASDADGDVITLAWDMDDGEDPRVNTSAGGLTDYSFRQARTFNSTGYFNISVTVTDGIAGHEVTRYRLVTVTSNNLPPTVSILNFTYELGEFATPGEAIQFTLVLSDPEMDTLEVTWDFGDNSSLQYFNLTDYVNGRTTLVVNHSYSQVGRYSLTLWYTDNQMGQGNHTKYYSAVVSVNEPTTKTVDHWSWWDYTSLVLLFLIPVSFVANVVRIRRQRRRLEEQGLTVEEMKLLQSDIVDEPDDYLKEEVD